MLEPQELLGPQGPLARALHGFTPRPQQQEMAQAVADTLAARGMLVAEGTPEDLCTAKGSYTGEFLCTHLRPKKAIS